MIRQDIAASPHPAVALYDLVADPYGEQNLLIGGIPAPEEQAAFDRLDAILATLGG